MTSSCKKRYSPPKLRKLNHEQAALILLGQAWDGDENAKELLECAADVLFPTYGNEDHLLVTRESGDRK